jgi:glycosyltransferase involved in cell wall biosynthesis
MIANAMSDRGHDVEVWTSPRRIGRLPLSSPVLRKWMGYADQYVLYPRNLRRSIQTQPHDTLFVATDQALGMWIPVFAHRPHVVHCHDFLALRSAKGEFPEYRTSWTGRQYQELIRRGFCEAKVFISVSQKTKDDLHRFLPITPKVSEVIHNGLNYPFRPMAVREALAHLESTALSSMPHGFLLHVGGNQWYKNRRGVLEIYRAYVSHAAHPYPLCLVGEDPDAELKNLAQSISGPGKVHFISGLTNEQLNAAYAHARVLLFPSLEEGFGWPIIEAMASGCPVVTTNIAPMIEVGGVSARFIPRMPLPKNERPDWAANSADVVGDVASCDGAVRVKLLQAGYAHAARFDSKRVMELYERIYLQTIAAN